ncbi:MAG: DUF3419 family protein [Bacilli bacterium]|nr:DUF3419 family protein [Bacilli bacterium]
MEINVDEVMRLAHKNHGLSNDFEKFCRMYIMTTENIREFLTLYDLHDKDVLSVAGSGDQMLNAYALGAKSVTLFDINPLAFAQAKLKKAAASTLTYEEFERFFSPEHKKTLFDLYLFDKISECLDENTKDLFKTIFTKHPGMDTFMNFYFRFYAKFQKQKDLNYYLYDEENYKKLQAIIETKPLKYIETPITSLKSNIQKDLYDFILLSNISDSIERIYDSNSLKQFKRLIHSLSKNLNKDGIIQVGYIYNLYCSSNDEIPIFADDDEREKIFTPDEFNTNLVTSYRFYSDKDKIITYEKKKRKVA